MKMVQMIPRLYSGVKREFTIHGFGGVFILVRDYLGTFLNRQLEPIVRYTKGSWYGAYETSDGTNSWPYAYLKWNKNGFAQ